MKDNYDLSLRSCGISGMIESKSRLVWPRESVRTFASVYTASVCTGGYIRRYIEMSAGVCSQRAFDNTRPSEGGRTPRAEHASPCSDVTRDATLIF